MTWVHIHNKDELEAFYRGVLPNILTEAKYHGYAIGLHGSLRRDLDLIAVPWSDDHSDKNDLARAIQEAACGMPQSSYQWEQKPCGRIAVSFPVCWTEWNETNLGHIDLSVMGVAVLPEESALAEFQRIFREERVKQSYNRGRGPVPHLPTWTITFTDATVRKLSGTAVVSPQKPTDKPGCTWPTCGCKTRCP